MSFSTHDGCFAAASRPGRFLFAAVFLLVLSCPAFAAAEPPALDLTGLQDISKIKKNDRSVITVLLSGKVHRFGIADFHAFVADVSIRIAEAPSSKKIAVRSGPDGWWSLRIKKYKGIDIPVSFIYEKSGWPSTKTNVITITDKDDTDLSIQFIDPDVYYKNMKPLTEKMLALMQPGKEAKMRNAVVATVGKSYASMHDDRLPHGDPGATVNRIKGAVGPIYFDESVQPNPGYAKTSVDGGVAWINVPPGTHKVSAKKDGVSYREVRFVVDATEGIELYVASPPDSIQGTNASPPGDASISIDAD